MSVDCRETHDIFIFCDNILYGFFYQTIASLKQLLHQNIGDAEQIYNESEYPFHNRNIRIRI